jgi:YD repeat-containing protein
MADNGVVRPPALESLPLTTRNPLHGSGLAAQRELHAFLETMPDGTRVLYRPDGTPVRRWDVDGSIHSFDAQGRPVSEATADGTKHPAASATLAAHHQKALVVDQPDGHARPLGVTFPDGTQARYEYMPDGGRVVSYSTGVVTTEDPWGHLLTERLPDGTVLTSFDSDGRSLGTVPEGGAPEPRPVRGAVAQPAGVSADDPRLAYRDRTMVNPAAPAARQVTADGTVYDGFDDQGRPTSGVTPSGSRFSQTYDAKGDSFQHLPDGTTVESSPAGKVVKQVAPDGTVFDGFDGQGRPTSGMSADGRRFTITYDAKGDSFEHLSDGTTVQSPPDRRAVNQVTAEGTTFDGQGGPTSGTSSGGSRFTNTYDAKGNSFEHPSDGTAVRSSPDQRAVNQVTAEGATFGGFAGQGGPTSGTSSGGSRFTNTSDAKGDSFQHPSAGAPAQSSPAGNAGNQVTAEGTTFDGQGRPTSGTLPDGTHYSVTYDAKGDSFQHMPDGTTVEYSPTGKVIKQVAPDGTMIDGFDGQGRPTSGTSADGTHFTTTYDAKGDSFQHLSDGTTIEYDKNGHPIKTWTAQGAEISWAVDVPALANAASRVAVEEELIKDAVRSLQATFTNLESIWTGPAGASLPPLVRGFNNATDRLVALLDDSVRRMRTAYQNYVSTESTNASNLH